ncbi:hypothetical protein TNCT_457221 [Trichonephila clavata]|uniref:Uncharacterized protein n=1 Tax=Trichonephila clavata TaxID=2740835 RepID=A0A8X6K004_TRICU|nr:hypothetical protein TNCT_457221 [Trichonephila clavata]
MELNLDHYLDSGMEMNLEQPPTSGNDMDVTLLCSDTASRPGTSQPSGCQRRRLATENLKYYAITIESIKSNINALRFNGLTDESNYIWKENHTRQADYTHLQEITVSKQKESSDDFVFPKKKKPCQLDSLIANIEPIERTRQIFNQPDQAMEKPLQTNLEQTSLKPKTPPPNNAEN